MTLVYFIPPAALPDDETLTPTTAGSIQDSFFLWITQIQRQLSPPIALLFNEFRFAMSDLLVCFFRAMFLLVAAFVRRNFLVNHVLLSASGYLSWYVAMRSLQETLQFCSKF